MCKQHPQIKEGKKCLLGRGNAALTGGGSTWAGKAMTPSSLSVLLAGISWGSLCNDSHQDSVEV